MNACVYKYPIVSRLGLLARTFVQTNLISTTIFYLQEEELWARTDLIVRIIDDKYKKGKHYKEKMRIIDVASLRDISLKDEQGRIHYGIRQSWLETVIPRADFDRVMVVRGKYKGRPAAIERKDKSRSKIVVLKLDFDDVCQHQAEEDDDYPY
uniref:KN17_SH3 domain-containing protein n=1 Tax=Heterorhabditis bacteriophora TaxID=37862 RepID=A0A1I7X765_HETBA